MKGLDLAQQYYHQIGAPMLRDQFSELIDRIAVGLVGPGSECFGFDDEISRDHDWGPAFCIWLTADDYRDHGKDLQNAYDELPKYFAGFGPRISSPGEQFRIGACPISTFYATYTGLDHAPSTLKEWISISDQALSTCTNGRIFADPLGQFSQWREVLTAFYPEDIRLKKISSRCVTLAQSGQYNLPRSLKRGELFSAHAAVTHFCTDILSLVYLFNKRYAPFYKWMHRGVKDLPLLGEWAHGLVSDLVVPTALGEKISPIEDACAVISRELQSEGLSDSSADFLLDHAYSVHGRIRDDGLRQHFTVLN